jgi:hypothetical protein
MPHTVRDIWKDATAKAELDALGLDAVPVVVRGTEYLEVFHVDQLREWLGMSHEAADASYLDVVAACERVLKSFESCLLQLPDAQITAPTPNRGRDMRDMTLNIYGGVAELARAMDSGRFETHGFAGPQRGFANAREMYEYAKGVRSEWVARALRVTPEEAGDLVKTERGEVTQYQMLDVIARHSAGHLRQCYVFLREIGIMPVHEMSDAEIAPIDVQKALY